MVVSVARRVALTAAMGVFVSMVDRAGFGPATFRFLGLYLANRTFFGL